MNTFLIIAGLLVWFTIGYQSFKFWWSHDFDFKTSDRPTACMAACMGPFAFLMGAVVHSRPKGDRIITPRRY